MQNDIVLPPIAAVGRETSSLEKTPAQPDSSPDLKDRSAGEPAQESFLLVLLRALSMWHG